MSDTVTLSGDPLNRIRQALQAAQHQVRAGQTALGGWHLEDALLEAEEAVSTALARINAAVEEDQDEAQDSSEAERRQRSWLPTYRAA